MPWLGFSPPQKHSCNLTCLSSLIVILQHRNREWILTSHTRGQPHGERLGNVKCLIFACTQGDLMRKSTSCSLPLLDFWSSSSVHSLWEAEKAPRKTGLEFTFISQLKCVTLLESWTFPAPNTSPH